MPDLRDGFRRPMPEFSPVPIWWWSGDRVTLCRLRSQLDRLVDQGVHNAVVLNLAPVGPLHGSLADRPAFGSEQWWDLWEGLCEHAERVGARLWFYDQIGFSGANLQGQLVHAHPEYAGVELEPELAGDGPDSTVRTVRQGFDYLSPEPCAALLDVVHGEFARRLGPWLGNVIAGSFQDELPSLPGWSPRFAVEFEQRAGYPISPGHPALWGGDDPEARRVRRDYQRVRAELAEESFFRPLAEWHERHGLTVGFDQQGPSRAGAPGATVRQYADYLRTHRWFSAPGSDHHGEARVHSSLAHHYGRPRTWIEAFHSSGWGGTLEETFDWLVPWLLAGATLYNPHAVYYSTRGGWYEWAPPSTCWRQPYWRHYGEFAGAVSRLCWLLTQGSHSCDVGVLFPTATVQAGTLVDGGRTRRARRAHRAYQELVGRMVWFDARPGVLDRCHRDFDVLDDDTVAGATITGATITGATVAAPGAELRTRDERYRAVVLPACPDLEEQTVERLVEFARAGGLLIAVGGPDEVHHRLADLAVRVDSSEDVARVLERLGRKVDADGPALHRVVGDRHVLVVPAARAGSATAQPMIADGLSWADGLRQEGYDFDPARYRDGCVVRVRGSIAEAEQWDPQTGEARRLPVALADSDADPDTDPDTDGGAVSEVRVRFDAPLAVLTWRELPARGAGETPEQAGEESPAEAAAEDPAEIAVEGADAYEDAPAEVRTLDGAWESELLPQTPDGLVAQWRPEHRLPDAEWSPVLVEHGTFGWIRGPLDPGEVSPEDHASSEEEAGRGAWRPLRYSLTRGIEKDPLWVSTLGPKGMVPEEFWHVDEVEPGQYVELRTSVPRPEAGQVWLAVGAGGRAEVWWNGERLGDDPGGYLRLDEVTVRRGDNRLWIRVYAEDAGPLRGSWALTVHPDAYRRPEWLVPADDGVAGDGAAAGEVGSEVVAATTLRLEEPVESATFQLGTTAPATLEINGRQVGVQGAFEPYGRKSRVLPWDVAQVLRVGENEIVIRQRDLGEPPAVLLDGLVRLAGGGVRELITAPGGRVADRGDSSWELHRDGEPVPASARRRPAGDPRWALLWARPHPLPEAGRTLLREPDPGELDPGELDPGELDPGELDPGEVSPGEVDAEARPDKAVPDGRVLPVVPDAREGAAPATEMFSTTIPPGAHRAYLPLLSGPPTVWLDGQPREPEPGDAGDWEVRVTGGRELRFAVQPLDGRAEGALLGGPIRFECGAGTIQPGPWHRIGLGSFSGAVRYRANVRLGRTRRVRLDLGAVRGTAEVLVNNRLAAVRIWSPYAVDITNHVHEGENHLEVLVCNTLAPWLDDASPTPYVFEGQRLSGLLGPVRIEEW